MNGDPGCDALRAKKPIWLGGAALLTAACLCVCFAACAERPSASDVPDTDVQSTDAPVVIVDATASAPLPGGETTPASEALPSGDATPEPPADTPAPTPNISVTTGRALPIDRPFQPVLAVVGNAPQVRPQTGLLDADIIYELSLDRTDHATRLLALYADKDPIRVGPIQDARIYFFDLRREWDAMLVYDEYPADAGYPVYDLSTVNFPAAYTESTAQYFVQDKTVSDDPANTLFCKLSEMRGTLYGVASVPASGARFSFRSGVRPENAKAFTKVGIPFTSSDYAKVEFVYQQDDNLLYRYERNSKGTLVQTKTLTVSSNGAAMASVPLCVQNLIVQYVKYEDLPGPYRSASLISNGKCDYFINGRYSAGRWSRASLGDPTVYTLRDGSPLVLEPGTTWIVFQSLHSDVKIQYGK